MPIACELHCPQQAHGRSRTRFLMPSMLPDPLHTGLHYRAATTHNRHNQRQVHHEQNPTRTSTVGSRADGRWANVRGPVHPPPLVLSYLGTNMYKRQEDTPTILDIPPFSLSIHANSLHTTPKKKKNGVLCMCCMFASPERASQQHCIHTVEAYTLT